MVIIYKATNKHTGKCYIGQTVYSLNDRRRQHLNDAKHGQGFRFHEAIRKYGEDAFIWEIIDETDDIIKLAELEGYWIEFYDSYNNGYNDTKGDLNPMFFEPIRTKHDNIMKSPEVRKKISDTMKRKVASGELFGETHRANISKAMKGNKNGGWTEDVRKLAQKALSKRVSVYSASGEYIKTFDSIRDGIEWWKLQPSYTLSKNRESLYEYVKRSIDKNIAISGVYWKLES